jgi:hypothetical protein
MIAVSHAPDVQALRAYPAVLGGDDGDALDRLVARLAMPAARRLFDEITGQAANPRGRRLRRLLLDRLNQARPDRAQRLFTSLFEPFLCPDLSLLAAPYPVPALITRPDVAAFWQVLSAAPLRRLAPMVGAELDEMARDRLVEDAILSPGALRRRDELARTAAEALDAVLMSSSATRDILGLLNAARRRLLEWQGADLDDVRQLARTDIVHIVTLLRLGPLAAPQVALVRRRTAQVPLNDAAMLGQAAAIAQGQAVVATLLGPDRAADAAVVPAMALHAGAAYLPVATALARRPDDPATPVAASALLGHYAACVRGLVKTLSHLVAAPDRLIDDPAARALAEAGLARHGRIRDALQATGLADALGDPFKIRFKAIAAPLDEMVEHLLCPAALARAGAVAEQAEAEVAPVDWLCRWIRCWEGQMRREGRLTAFTVAWRARLALALEQGVHRATREAGALSEARAMARLAQLARLGRLHMAVGLDLGPALPVTSHTMLTICEIAIHAQFRAEAEPDLEERAVVATFIARIRAEAARTARRWVAADHQRLITLAAKAGY